MVARTDLVDCACLICVARKCDSSPCHNKVTIVKKNEAVQQSDKMHSEQTNE